MKPWYFFLFLISALTSNSITAQPLVNSVTYDSQSGNLTVTGTNFESVPGISNDIDAGKIQIFGYQGSGYSLTSAYNVDITDENGFTINLLGAEKLLVDNLLNKNGTQAWDGTIYKVTFFDTWYAGYSSGVDENYPIVVAGVLNKPPKVNNLVLSGSFINGEIVSLTYDYSDLETDLEGSSYVKWYSYSDIDGSDKTLITDAAGKTYKLQTQDLGKYINAEVIPVAQSGATPGDAVSSLITGPVLNAKPVASNLSISGNSYLNQTVSAVFLYFDADGDTQSSGIYQWYRSDNVNGPDEIIDGATSQNYLVTQADLNKYLSFEVTPVASSGNTTGLKVTSPRVAVLNEAPTANSVSINGTFNIWQELQGTYSYSDLEGDQEALSGYTWYRANTADGVGKVQISTNSRTYIVQSADLNKYLSFEVKPVASSGTTMGTAEASAFLGPVGNSAPTVTNVRIMGTQTVCKTLRGEYSYNDLEGDPEGATAFRWLRATSVNGTKTPIPEATNREFTLTTMDQGLFIFFEVLPRAISGSTTGIPTLSSPTGVIINQLPTATIVGSASICPGSVAKLTISFTGSPPWSLTYFDGTERHKLVSSDQLYFLNVSKNGTYKADTLVDNIGCPVTNLPSSATITILSLPQVEIVGLNSAYNFRSNPVHLTGNPTGGNFSGPGVFPSTNMFYPSIAGTQGSPHAIIYEYKAPLTGCANRDTVLVEIIDADASITGIRSSSRYCNFDRPFTITGANVVGTTGGFSISGGLGLVDNHDNTATINPALLTSGNYTISYSYFDGVQLTIYKDLSVEMVEEARIFGLDNSQYCNNASPVELTSNYFGGIFTGNAVTKNMFNKYYFNPLMEASGTTLVSYSYTTNYGCAISNSVEKTIATVPNADFKIQNSCYNGDSTSFQNTTIFSQPVTKWIWSFGDLQSSEVENRSVSFEPKHKYPRAGNRTVRLIAENNSGCRDTVERIVHLGDTPVADFYWESECFEKGLPVSFKNSSVNIDEIAKYKWTMEDTSKLNFIYTSKDVLHTFPLIKNYLVKYKITSQYGCFDSIQKVISLRPVFYLKDTFYFNTFETSNGYWLSADSVLTNNWHYGIPNGAKILSSYSGKNSFYTNLKEARNNQQLVITSPCFDLTGVKRPFISMETFADAAEGQEGAVLQYTLSPGNKWENVGGYATGVNWFNNFAIQSQPAGQQTGWSGQTNAWVESRHDLDFLSNAPKVRFRLVYGMNSKSTGNDGFAFDNVYIGNRSKYVLFEQFTNNSQIESFNANKWLDSIVGQNMGDAIAIQYHTSFPGIDTFNMHNSSDPGSRILYYGVGLTPASLLEGGTDSKYMYDFKSKGPNSLDVKILSLKDAVFSLNLSANKTSEKISGSLDIKALKEFTKHDISVRIVIVEDIVSQVSDKKVVYRNVVKKILPSAGGNLITGAWAKGKIETVNFSWNYKNVYNPSNIHVVAFLQDENSREVFQVASDDTSGVISGITVIKEKEEESFKTLVYPNPAQEWVNIDFLEKVSGDFTIQFFTINGKLIYTDKIFKGVNRYEFNTQNVSNGIYFIRILKHSRVISSSKLVVIH